MNALVFAPLHASEKRPGDAMEFLREGESFCRVHKLRPEVLLFDNRAEPAERRARVLEALHELQPGSLDVMAFFSHGFPDHIQAGFYNQHARGLAKALKEVAAPAFTVALYCCSTGADDDGSDADERSPGPGGDGGFADRLRDELADAGVRATVFAHSTSGHCTRNRFCRVFLPETRQGGKWVVDPHGELWQAWSKALQTDKDFRFRFPFMSASEIESELRQQT